MQRAEAAAQLLLNNDNTLAIAHDPDRCYAWLQAHQLLWPKQDGGNICKKVGCPGWRQPMRYQADRNRADGDRFRCRGDFNHTQSLRDETIFEGSRAPLPLIYRAFFHHFLEGHSIQRVVRELGLNKNTVSKIYSVAPYAIHLNEIWDRVFEPICQQRIVERENPTIWARLELGEDLDNRRPFYNSAACEIDEALMTHIAGEQVWVIGAWDRADRRTIVEVVGNDRSSQNIERFVRQYIHTPQVQGDFMHRTRVYHDGWLGYNFLQAPDCPYEGFTVIHEGNRFGTDIFSTNRIEGYWANLRRVTKFDQGRHFNNIREVQIEVDLGNWLIKNHQNRAELLAQALLSLTFRGGGIGANIRNLQTLEEGLDHNDVNDNIEIN